MSRLLRVNDKIRSGLLVVILVVFYTIGFLGLQFGEKHYFLSFSPMNLLISFGCLLASLKNWTAQRILTLITIALLTLVLEWIGVHTGYLFGTYSYGNSLGYKVDEIPLLIGINWILLCYGSCALAVKIPVNRWIQALVAASLMTLLDFIMEPVAMNSDFWSWENNEVPIYNYVCWWCLSFLLNSWIIKREQLKDAVVARFLFGIITLFFVACYISN